MKSRVSELMDGELDSTDAEEVVTAIQKGDDNLLSDWEAYHIIGDVLRQSVVNINVSERVREQLAGEPVLLVPHLLKPHRPRKRKLLGLSVAASIAVVSVGWLISQSMEQHQIPREVYVTEQMNKEPATVEERSATTFQPASAYMLPSVPINNGHDHYPLVYRGFTHGGMIYHPHAGMHQIAEPSQEKPILSSE